MRLTNKKILFATLIVASILVILYFNKRSISQNLASKKKSKENVQLSSNNKTQKRQTKIIPSQDEVFNDDESEISKKITLALEEHRKLQGNNTNISKIEEEEKSQQRKINAEILENLIGLENTFFIHGRAVDMSVVSISGMFDDSTFYQFLDDLEKNAQANPETLDTNNAYLNSFYGALESLENAQIHINEFQCGQASCIGSFNSFNNSDWNNFISARRNLFNEEYPLNTFVDYPQIIDDGSTVHRIFFSFNGNIDAFFTPPQTQPLPISGGK